MNGYKKIKPKNKNMIIRDPVTKIILSEKGELKPWINREGSFWRRRVEEGTCVICDNEVDFDSENNIIKKAVKK